MCLQMYTHNGQLKVSKAARTLVTTERAAIPFRISSQAPMQWALAATGRLNWVVSFQASTRTSMMLLMSASSGASGKEATNSVMKPNWITAQQSHERVVKSDMKQTAPSAAYLKTLHV